MNIKEILSEIVPKAELSDENRKTLSDWLDQFEKAPSEQELLKTIEQLQAERDSARKSLDDMIYKDHVAQLAENYSFSDKGYLEYLGKLNKIDFADSTDSKNFMNRLLQESPRFFQLKLQSGTGGNANPDCQTPVFGNHQQDDILQLLNNAPEVRG